MPTESLPKNQKFEIWNFCHYFNNNLDCPVAEFGCKFLHQKSGKCKLLQCSVRLKTCLRQKLWTLPTVTLPMSQMMICMWSQKMKLNARYVNVHLWMKSSWSGMLQQIMLKEQTMFEPVVCNKPIVAGLVTVFYREMIITLCYWLHTLINITYLLTLLQIQHNKTKTHTFHRYRNFGT